ncbi:hypothetical protein FRC12_000089 [Ceratobasidium sp. 428]|nr:hypothetical protein FRC12_000089 [Ceratobasidium sp. 428]
MRRHIRTAHTAEGIRTVVEGCLPREVAATVGSMARPAIQSYARQLRSDPLAGPVSAPATSVPALVAPYPPAIVAAVVPVLNVVTTQVLPNPAFAPTKTAPTPVVVSTPSTNVAIHLAAPTSIALRPPKPAADALNRPKAN